MATSLEDLVRFATARIGPNSSLEEIEKAVGISKTVADTAKASREHQNAGAQTSLEWFKALPSLAVPIISLLTLLGTVWIQAQQMHASRQQDEDKQWRDFLIGVRESVKGSSNQIISDPTFATQLKSFWNSPVYRSQVVELAKRLMGNIANKNAFDDLFSIVFPNIDVIDIGDLADLDKNVARSQASEVAICRSLSAGLKLPQTLPTMICDYRSITDSDLNTYLSGLDDKRISDINQARRDFAALVMQQAATSQLLARRLRQGASSSSRPIDLSGSYLSWSDLSGVDFRKIDLSGAVLDTVNLTGAIFVPLKGTPKWMAGTNWWDAKEVEPKLLEFLIKTVFPGFVKLEAIVGDKPLTREYYANKVIELCKIARLTCDASELQFDASNFTMSPLPPS